MSLFPIALSCLLLALPLLARAQTTPVNDARITSLPGLPTDEFPSNYEMYSGYIQLNGTTMNLFYWFVTSARSPSTDPLVLWLQGGPGCSGIGDGNLFEIGPFRTTLLQGGANPQIGLTKASYSWNDIANVIFIDSPCGVGFSYGTSPGDNRHNDNSTAINTYVFMQQFYELYPQFSSNPFWITGESYGGVYIPTLAYEILTNDSSPQLAANLRKGGITMGNPETKCGYGFHTGSLVEINLQVNLFYWHGMMSLLDYNKWNELGCNTPLNPPNSEACYSLAIEIQETVGILRQPPAPKLEEDFNKYVNPDCLYYDYCTGNGTLDFVDNKIEGCLGIPQRSDLYLNNMAVKKAIHANPDVHWEECGGIDYTTNVQSTIPYLEAIFDLAPGIPYMIYSGTVDIATVPFAFTQSCLNTMNRTLTRRWAPYSVGGMLAGYSEVFDAYTYATVKGAGHEAPGYQPRIAYELWTTFVETGGVPNY